MKKFLSALLFVLVFFDTYSQTNISGTVSGIWSKEKSPYLVSGDLNIPINENLIIEPGVKIIFQGHYKFDIIGQLLALGNRNDSIIFTVNDTLGFSNSAIPDGSWNGINFIQETIKYNLINCCIFEFAKGLNIDFGGAIDIRKMRGNVEILNSVFRNNISTVGGAIHYDGLSSGAQKIITIKNCGFYNNWATSNGGAIRFNGFGGLNELSNCTFINNKADSNGGAISIQASKISNCLFKNNSAINSGGAVENVGSTSLIIYNSIFDHNSAAKGGAYYANAGVFSGLINCTIVNNISSNSAIYLGNTFVFSFDIKNSIVWNPGSPEISLNDAATKKTIENSIIRNAKDSSWFSSTCMDTNPLLSNVESSKYWPTIQSPCIDKGNNAYLDPAILVDYNNKCRIWDGKNKGNKIVDIGAVEFNSVDSLPVIKNNLADIALCEGSKLLLELSANAERDDYKYEWFKNYNSLNHSSPSYSIDSVTTVNSGYYFCRISNKYGQIQSDIIKTMVKKIPEKPVIPYGVDDTITNSIDSSYYEIHKINNSETIEWELSPTASGNIKFNDTLAVIKWNRPYQGEASLVVKNSNGICFSLSDTLQLVVQRIPNNIETLNIYKPLIYPNPSSGNFTIDFSRTEEKNIDIVITDNLGRIVKRESFINKNFTKEYKLPHGLYFVIIKTQNRILSTNKIVVN